VFWFNPMYLIFISPALLLMLWAQYRVKSSYSRAMQIPAPLSGAAAARYILDQAGLQDVDRERIAVGGVSLGGLISVMAAGRDPRFRALVQGNTPIQRKRASQSNTRILTKWRGYVQLTVDGKTVSMRISDSWLNARLAQFGEAPCAFVLDAANPSHFKAAARSRWFGAQISWFDAGQVGWRLGYR
jgi:dienelactone hydrolase